jgi:putative transposase
VTQRGNNREDVFFADEDRDTYLEFLEHQSKRHGAQLLGYCLMTNHVHLVVLPLSPESLAKGLGRTHFLHTQHINRTRGRSGHLWQNRFYSCAVDADHVLAVMRYVERNPVRAGLVSQAWDYPWSSAAAHVGASVARGSLDMPWWARATDAQTWRSLLSADQREADTRRVRDNTRSGRPLVGTDLLRRLEMALGRRLTPRPVGRPKKQKKQGQSPV